MKTTTVACAIVAATLGPGSLSYAQPNDPPDNRSEQRGSRQGDRHDRHQDNRRADRHDDRRGNSHANRHDDRRGNDYSDRRYDYPDARRNDRHEYYNARGPQFRRGSYIPYEYRSRQYVVTHYGPYHLSPPPRGHQWVQVGSDYVLIAIATGLIANIILNN